MFQASPGENGREYSIQFPSKPLVAELDKRGPDSIKRDDVWSSLSFTKNVAPGAGGWNATLRSSGVRLLEEDGAIIENLLLSQSAAPVLMGYPRKTGKNAEVLSGQCAGQGFWFRFRRVMEKSATPPEFTEPPLQPNYNPLVLRTRCRRYLQKLGWLWGSRFGFPKPTRESVASAMSCPALLENLPYTQFSTEASAKAVEQIDVLWLQKKAIVRAFEVEHTTAVYSGILRMADLLALQPNFHTKLHIVARC